VFSLGEQKLEWAIAYVNNQKQHHKSGELIKSLEYTTPNPSPPHPKNPPSIKQQIDPT
jgi:hypothetical protein